MSISAKTLRMPQYGRETYCAGPDLGVGGELVGVLRVPSESAEWSRSRLGTARGTHVANVEEEALEIVELLLSDPQETRV